MLSTMQKHKNKIAQAATLWLFLLTAAAAYADTTKISPDLQPLLSNPSASAHVIIQYNSSPSSSGGGLLGGLLGGVLGTVVDLLGGVLNIVFSLIPAVSATVNGSQ